MVQWASFGALFVSAGILLAGNGLFGTLVAIRANLEAFSPTIIGLLGSAFYVGFIVSSMQSPRLIRRVGHIRTFAALAAILAAAALFHALIVQPIIWIFLRVISGFCFSGLTLVIESWLNERVGNEDRGRVLSIYRMVDLGSVTIGQFFLTIADPQSFAIFSITALFFCFCIVPLTMTRTMAPAPLVTPQLRLRRLINVSPLGTLGVFSVGLVNGTIRMIMPAVAQDIGLTVAQVGWLMIAFILGGALVQYPLGLLSDRIDRRITLIITTGIALMMSIGMSFAILAGPTAFILVTFLFGGFALPIYSLAVAHTNDFAKADEFVEVSAGLFLLFGIGAAIGPFLGSAVIDVFGPHALFYYTFGVHFVLITFGIYRQMARTTVPRALRRQYVGLMRTSANIFGLDPRSRHHDGSKSGERAPR